MKIFHKCYIFLSSVWKALCARICTNGKFQATWINSIRGALKIEILGDGCVTIGHFLMSRGPLYLKPVNECYNNKRCSYWNWSCNSGLSSSDKRCIEKGLECQGFRQE